MLTAHPLTDRCQRTGDEAGAHPCPCSPCEYVRMLDRASARLRSRPRVLLLSLAAVVAMCAAPIPER